MKAKRRRLPGLPGMLLVVAALLLAACGSDAQASGSSIVIDLTAGSVTAGRSVTVEAVTGSAQLTDASGGSPHTPAIGESVPQGAVLSTGNDGEVVLGLDDGTAVVIPASSQVNLSQMAGTPQSPITRFFLNIGNVFAFHQGNLSDTAAFEVQTPSGVAAIRGSSMEVAYNEKGLASADNGQLGRRVGLANLSIGATFCFEGTCSYTPDGGSQVDLSGGEGVEQASDGTMGDKKPMTDAELAAALEALAKAKAAGLVDGLDVNLFLLVTPTPSPVPGPVNPQPLPASTPVPSCNPGEWTGCGGRPPEITCPFDYVAECGADGQWGACQWDPSTCSPQAQPTADQGGGGSSGGGKSCKASMDRIKMRRQRRQIHLRQDRCVHLRLPIRRQSEGITQQEMFSGGTQFIVCPRGFAMG